MNRLKWLQACRDLLERIRDVERDCALLEGMQVVGQDEQLVVDLQLVRSKSILQQLRMEYPVRMDQAMKSLASLRGMERKCLWTYYVLGLSNGGAAQELQYDPREFLRKKAEGLRKLKQLDEEDQHA